MTQHGLKFALRLTSDVHVVQIKTERDSTEDLSDNWALLVGSRARTAGIAEPKLVILTSNYRRFFSPFIDFISGLEKDNPGRDIVVVVPELVMKPLAASVLHNNRGSILRTLLRMQCSSRVVVVDTPYHLHE